MADCLVGIFDEFSNSNDTTKNIYSNPKGVAQQGSTPPPVLTYN